MRSSLDRLRSEHFDVVVIGAGVHGACTALESAQRGLRTALIDKGDFSSATSHNSLKIVHGGIRYLQHLDLRRLRQSVRERRFWLRCAPHMVIPLEFWIPLRGWGTRGAAALWSAIRVHEVLAWDRNRGLDARQRLPRGGLRGRGSVRDGVGDIWGSEAPRAAVWWDGQMLDADRLVLECIAGAEHNGAVAANYVEAVGVETTRDAKVAGLEVRDSLDGSEFRIRARNVVFAAGPWTAGLAERLTSDGATARHRTQVRNMNIVVPKKLDGFALGIYSRRKSDAVVGESNRLYFVTPWRNCTVIGTTHEPFDGDPDAYRVTDAEVRDFVEEIQEASPALGIHHDEVQYVYGGLTPAEGSAGSSHHSRTAEVVDHAQSGGAAGAFSIIGVKYTTARALAEQVIDCIGRRESKVTQSLSAVTPLPGAAGVGSLPQLVAKVIEDFAIDEDDALDLAIAYGSRYLRVLELAEKPLTRESILAARVRYAVRSEMACTLEDVALRRIDWIQRGLADRQQLRAMNSVMAREADWSDDKQRQQYAALDQKLSEQALTPSWSGE